MKWYKLALHKAYFDTGYGLLSYPKYILLMAGGGSILLTGGESTALVVSIGGAIGIFCYFLGRWCFKSGFMKATIEVANQYNAFVGEIRKHVKKRKI